jgi:hypothetical protein
VEKGRELLHLAGHIRCVTAVAFSKDGRRIITGSLDRTARLWDAASTDQVAAWDEEERAAERSKQAFIRLREEQVAEQKRQRISQVRSDAGIITRWLILAPIALSTNQSGPEGLKWEQIRAEGAVTPKAGDIVTVGGNDLKWEEMIAVDFVIDFNALAKRITPRSVGYAVCYIWSEAEQHGLRMLLGSDDEAIVYLNGAKVHEASVQRSFLADQDHVPDLSLKAGLNVLVLKVVNEVGDWQASIRFTDAQDKPVHGIRVTLDPTEGFAQRP